jgi:hypothetical protein
LISKSITYPFDAIVGIESGQTNIGEIERGGVTKWKKIMQRCSKAGYINAEREVMGKEEGMQKAQRYVYVYGFVEEATKKWRKKIG